MNPQDIDTNEVLSFVLAALPPPPATVLEVGAGDGRLASRLRERGFRVTAIDADADAVAAAKARGAEVQRADVLSYRGGPFDAVIYTRSFHHVSPIDAAVAKSRELLVPHGVLVLDEFAHDAMDLQSAAWFYDVHAILEDAGALAPDERSRRHAGHAHADAHHGHREEPKNPLERWRHRHNHNDNHAPPHHGGQAMLDALGTAFEVTQVNRQPYLYRYLADRLAADAQGVRLFEKVRTLEQERATLGLLVPIGLRVVARPRA